MASQTDLEPLKSEATESEQVSRLKRYDQTIIHFEKFLELMPEAPEAPQVKSILKTVRG